MSILACISLVIEDSLVIVDNLPPTDESTIKRGDCTSNIGMAAAVTCLKVPPPMIPTALKPDF